MAVLGFFEPQAFDSTGQRHLRVNDLLNPWLAFHSFREFSSGAIDQVSTSHHCQLRDTTLPSPAGDFQHQNFRQIKLNFPWANAKRGSSAKAAPTWNITFHTLLLQSIQKENKMKWKSVLLLLLLLLTSRLRNKTTGFAQRKIAFWQRSGVRNSASDAKMPESYEQRNERFLQPKQFCHLGCAFSCYCSDKNLLLRELGFQPEIYNLCIQERLQIPTHFPASQLPSVRSSYFHSFHIFTTLDSNWEAVNSTAGTGSFSLKTESSEFPLPLPPSSEYFIQALCYHLITQHLEHTGVSSTNTMMEWEWMQEGMRSLKEEHPNAL